MTMTNTQKAEVEAYRRRRLEPNPTLKDVRDELAAIHETLRKVIVLFNNGGVGSSDRPFLCPKCEGWKKIQHCSGTAINQIDCPVCDGEGVVWG